MSNLGSLHTCLQGFTPLHRAAYLAHHDGYLEIYEYLLVRG